RAAATPADARRHARPIRPTRAGPPDRPSHTHADVGAECAAAVPALAASVAASSAADINPYLSRTKIHPLWSRLPPPRGSMAESRLKQLMIRPTDGTVPRGDQPSKVIRDRRFAQAPASATPSARLTYLAQPVRRTG